MPIPVTTRNVIAHPGHFADTPSLYAQAWDQLLEQHGRTRDAARTGPARHRIEPERPGDLMDRIRQEAARLGRPGPAPLICPGAVLGGASAEASQ